MAAYLLFACGLYFHKYSGVGHIQLHLLLFNFSFHTISTTNQRNYVYVKNIRLIARFVAPFAFAATNSAVYLATLLAVNSVTVNSEQFLLFGEDRRARQRKSVSEKLI